MTQRVSRRNFLKWAAASGGISVAGFDPARRSWVPLAQAKGRSFEDAPKLDGALLLDEASCRAIAVDKSDLFHQIPVAVLRPGSVRDVVATVQYANRHSLKVAIKGEGHSQYGQTQARGGIAIDSRTLNAVQLRGKSAIDAQPGALWADVAKATLPEGLTPPVYPATCMALTVGGTLSVGGIGNTSHRLGAQVDTVTELDVVTGDGRLVTCSPDHESELFEMVLAGLGQCGLIVRARIPAQAAPTHIALQELVYRDLDRYLVDQGRLAADGRFDSLRGNARRNAAGQWTFTVEGGKFFSAAEAPDLTPLTAGLRFDSAAAPTRMTYRDYLFRFEAQAAATFATARPRAFVTMWVPASTTKEFVSSILALPPEAAMLGRVAGSEQFSFYPLNTRRFTRPLFKVPAEEQVFAVWQFRSAPSDDRAAVAALSAGNRELLARMNAAGGKRYSPYTGVLMSPEEWAAHFGADTWRRLSAAKRKFDPANVLSPGARMFPSST
jgi:cytokinin dehydrogenase